MEAAWQPIDHTGAYFADWFQYPYFGANFPAEVLQVGSVFLIMP